MKKCMIQEVDNYDFIITDEKGVVHRLNIEFYSEYKPQVNDILYIDDSVLKEVNLYAYEEINDTDNIDIKDVIKVLSSGKYYYYKRVYG